MGNIEQGQESQPASFRKIWLCRMPDCRSELVYPLDWEPMDTSPASWRMLLRCPNCEDRYEDVFSKNEVEHLDDAMTRGDATLLGDLRRITHYNMSEETEFWLGH